MKDFIMGALPVGSLGKRSCCGTKKMTASVILENYSKGKIMKRIGEGMELLARKQQRCFPENQHPHGTLTERQL